MDKSIFEELRNIAERIGKLEHSPEKGKLVCELSDIINTLGAQIATQKVEALADVVAETSDTSTATEDIDCTLDPVELDEF